MTHQVLIPTGIRFEGITIAKLNEMAIAHAKENPGRPWSLMATP